MFFRIKINTFIASISANRLMLCVIKTPNVGLSDYVAEEINSVE
jgi:hypothetical protein